MTKILLTHNGLIITTLVNLADVINSKLKKRFVKYRIYQQIIILHHLHIDMVRLYWVCSL